MSILVTAIAGSAFEFANLRRNNGQFMVVAYMISDIVFSRRFIYSSFPTRAFRIGRHSTDPDFGIFFMFLDYMPFKVCFSREQLIA